MTITAAPQAPSLAVLPISDTEWRVSDPHRPSDDALCLVGFIQEIRGRFEATEIAHPRERHYYGSLDAAVSSLASTR